MGRKKGDKDIGKKKRREREGVIFQGNIEIGIDELIFDHLPDDAGHLVPIHLDDWIFDLDLCHERNSFCL